MRNMIKYSFFILIFVFIGCSSNKLENKSLLIIDKLFQGLKNKKPDESLMKLLSLNKNINISDSATKSLITKFTYINSYSGAYLGNKLLLKRNIKDNIIIYSYLVMYKIKFYRFIFIFYKPDDVVLPYKFAFDDNVEFELEESQRLYLHNNI